MIKPATGRLLICLKLLCVIGIAGNAAGMVASIQSDYNRISTIDLIVLTGSLAVLLSLPHTGRRCPWEFWVGTTVGAMLIVSAPRGDQGPRQVQGGVRATVSFYGYELTAAFITNEEIVLGAAKYEACTCSECVSRYTGRLVRHHTETNRSLTGLCAFCLTGAVLHCLDL